MKLYHHIHKIWLLTLLEKHKVYKLAALEAQLTQSALSQNMANLEKALGKPLVIKTKLGIELTDFANMIVMNSRPILENIDKIHTTADELSGTIKIGAYDSLTINFLSYALPKLQREFPNAKFQTVNQGSSQIKHMVKNGTLDFGLIIDDGVDLGLEKSHLKEINLGIYCHSLNLYDITDFQRILKESGLISLSLDNTELPHYMRNLLDAIPFPYHVTIAYSSFDAIKNSLIGNENIGILPDLIAQNDSDLTLLWDGGDSHHQHQAVLISRPTVRSEIKKSLAELLCEQMKGSDQ